MNREEMAEVSNGELNTVDSMGRFYLKEIRAILVTIWVTQLITILLR